MQARLLEMLRTSAEEAKSFALEMRPGTQAACMLGLNQQNHAKARRGCHSE